MGKDEQCLMCSFVDYWQSIGWTMAGCSVMLIVILIWDEIRTEIRFRTWQAHERSAEAKHEQEKEAQ
jgi:hypothetical protein